MTPHWIQTIACTKPIPRPRKSRWEWVKIYDAMEDGDGMSVQFWKCKQDLKESFVEEAKLAFGKALEQVIRLGGNPIILYPND